MPSHKYVYHVCGSPTSKFFYDLSLIYARNTFVPSGWEEHFIVVEPDGKWRIGNSLRHLSRKSTPQKIIAGLHRKAIVVPHLFCLEGMTTYRKFFEEILCYQVVGSSGDVMAVAADKNLSRQRVKSHGVQIAGGGLTSEIDVHSLQLPIIIKPNTEDNSVGLSMITKASDIDNAIKHAKAFGGAVLAEQYISGREIRIAVIETSSGYFVPPIIEYLVSAQNPIRRTSDKLKLNRSGQPENQVQSTPIEMVCPAHLDAFLQKRLSDQAIRAHKALGARDYSLFDFRIHDGSDIPYFLEAGLFWSFSEAGMITKMLRASDLPIEDLIGEIWDRRLLKKA